MKPEATKTQSIFGQIEQVVAENMVREGKLRMIAQEDIPPTALYHNGIKAAFAVIVPREYNEEFERRISILRS